MKLNMSLELAKKFGTPLYIYDGDVIEKKYQELQDAFKHLPLITLYAMKANYNPHILNILKNIGAWIDAVSVGDMLMALKCGFPPERILYTANNITWDEMLIVANKNITFNIGSLSELERYGKAFPNSHICLRVNPAVVAGAHVNIRTAGDFTKFGILIKDISKALVIAKKYQLKIIGLHKHTGSGIKNVEKFIEAVKNLLSIANPKSFPDLEFIDFGGGLNVTYRPYEKKMDYKVFGSRITNIYLSFCKNFGKKLSLFFEPGKYLVAECGTLIIEVNTIKNNNGRLIVGTNSGFPQLIRPVFYKAYHHILNLSHPFGIPYKYDICGNICETGDHFAKGRKIPEIREGDILAIQHAGAYCYSMGSVYNLRPMPAEVLVYENEIKLIRKRLSEEELVNSILNEAFLDHNFLCQSNLVISI